MRIINPESQQGTQPTFLVNRTPLILALWNREPLGEAILGVILGLLAGIAGLAASFYFGEPLILPGLFAGIAFLYMTMRWPEIGVLALVGVTGNLVDTEWLPYLDIGPIAFHLSDLILGWLLVLLLLRATGKPGFRLIHSPMNAPLLLFCAAILLSLINAVLVYQVDAHDAMRLGRKFMYWLAFFPALQLIRNRAALQRLQTGLWVLTAVFALGVIFPDLFSRWHLLPTQTQTLVTAGREFAGVKRIYFAGERLLYAMIPVAIGTLAVQKKGNPWWRISILGMALYWLVFSFQRNYWLTTLISSGLMIVLLSNRERFRLSRRLLPLFLLGLILLLGLLISKPVVIESNLDAIKNRMTSLTNNPTLTDESLRYRMFENRYALPQIIDHPILGLGIGNRYRPFFGEELHSFALDWYAHNVYLWIAVMMGMVGLIPFLWLCMAYVLRSLRQWRAIRPDSLRGPYLGFVMGFIGMMVSNLVAPNFLQTWSLTIYPVMIAMGENILRFSRMEGSD
jgi:O-antigen ligase